MSNTPTVITAGFLWPGVISYINPLFFFLAYTLLALKQSLGQSANYTGADNSLARPGRKQATATEGLMFIYPIYYHNWRNITTNYKYNKISIKGNILTIQRNTSESR